MILQIILAIAALFFFWRWRTEKQISKYYWTQWDYFEGEYYKVYDAWVSKLSPDELKRVQQHSLDKDKKSYELTEPLKEPI